MSNLPWAVPCILAVLGAIIKISRQTGRIEEGVKGLYGRVERIEHRLDGNWSRVRR